MSPIHYLIWNNFIVHDLNHIRLYLYTKIEVIYFRLCKYRIAFIYKLASIVKDFNK